MTKLFDHINVVPRFARSANLERDMTRAEPLDGYIVTARALDVVERVATVAARDTGGGAWSITGPYGSGKSSLALLLDAVFGEPGEARERALRLVEDASPNARGLIEQTHKARATTEDGFVRGLVTAGREPISHTLLRALHSAAARRHGDLTTSSTSFEAREQLKAALGDLNSDDPRRMGPSPGLLVDIARKLAREAPLLLIIDEFGKNLEAIRDGGDSDPYLLQQLAEAGQSGETPIFLITLQHLAFEDYLSGLDDAQRREWAKVQGRFEDVTFVESWAQTRSLIASVFDIQSDPLRDRIAEWARQQAEAVASIGLSDLADPDVLAGCYPLHPLTAGVLPELCSRYGQHERTLFSFLTGHEPSTAASFLSTVETPPADQPLPTLGLDALYDYFVGGGTLSMGGAGTSGRWTEIATRLRDVHGLSERCEKVAKSVAVLNLVSSGGPLRASRHLLELAFGDVEQDLAELDRRGIVTHRDFADEYRIWQGTDVDIRAMLERARQQAHRRPLLELLKEIDDPSPVVAARHSTEHETLRVFLRRYVDGRSPVAPLDPLSPYDGEFVLVVGGESEPPKLEFSESALAKPIVAAVPNSIGLLADAAAEVAAIRSLLDEDPVADDWVARRELGERLAQAQAAFDGALIETFDSDNCTWSLLSADGPIPLPAGSGTTALSAAADHVYTQTPRVGNEMLNRTDLTSQGAKARRVLLEAMINHGDEEGLGLEGYGPEVAMYRSFLLASGMHGVDRRKQASSFRRPPEESSVRPAWELVEAEFTRAKQRRVNLEDIHGALQSPPVGLKAGAVPVLVTACLLAHADQVAIYEHGTFKPLLSPEISERMVRNPRHFEVKHFSNASGARRQVIEELAERLGVTPSFRRHRVANVLAIVAHLVSKYRQLPNYTRHTKQLSPSALQLRNALEAAVEPDELLFDALPKALSYRAIPSNTKSYKHARAFATDVAQALDELESAHQALLDSLVQEVLEATAEKTRIAVVGQAASLQSEVLDPSIRSFVLTLANEAVDTDRDWANAIGTVVVKKAPSEWRDADRERFSVELRHYVAAFRRLVALHSDQRATGGGPFDALRVTITRPDGLEHVQLAGIDEEIRESASAALEGTLSTLAQLTGSENRALDTVVALLGERILGMRYNSEQEQDDQVVELAREATNE